MRDIAEGLRDLLGRDAALGQALADLRDINAFERHAGEVGAIRDALDRQARVLRHRRIECLGRLHRALQSSFEPVHEVSRHQRRIQAIAAALVHVLGADGMAGQHAAGVVMQLQRGLGQRETLRLRTAGAGCTASCAWWTSGLFFAAASTCWTIFTIPTTENWRRRALILQ